MALVKVYSLPFCSTTAVTVTVVTRALSGVHWKGMSRVLPAAMV